MKKIICSRKMRAAASTFMMIPVTIISFMFYHYGRNLYAVIFEGMSLVVYSIWVSLGPVRDDDNYDPDDEE